MIQQSFAEKKGRESFGQNPFTCYINIDSPMPNLPLLTASFLDQLVENSEQAFRWASKWDKSVISISPTNELGCVFLLGDDLKGKNFVPVSTTLKREPSDLLKNMPEGQLAFIGMNNKPTTVDGFLISYFHLVNELIWDRACVASGEKTVNLVTYRKALEEVTNGGFTVGVISETEIVQAKKADPRISVRIYGSNVNSSVPQIMGAVIPK